MADLALPDYYNATLIKEEIDKWKAEDFLRGYLIVNTDFNSLKVLNILPYHVTLIKIQPFTLLMGKMPS